MLIGWLTFLFTPKVGPCMVRAPCSVCGWSLLKKGENIVKGGGELGEGEIRMSFVLLSVMILKLEIFSF